MHNNYIRNVTRKNSVRIFYPFSYRNNCIYLFFLDVLEAKSVGLQSSTSEKATDVPLQPISNSSQEPLVNNQIMLQTQLYDE